MNVVIDELIVEKDRPEHITKHGIEVNEVLEVVFGNFVYVRGRQDCWLLIGKTKDGRFLTIVIGERKGENIYGLVTARPSRKDEKSFYQEFTLNQGGEQDESNIR